MQGEPVFVRLVINLGLRILESRACGCFELDSRRPRQQRLLGNDRANSADP